ncbi:MAG: hypothetical protein GXY33_07945 [Phycisphaerae bacterium]|nr:hypothetical protein [Phycisphaerae bacterium]
MRLTNGKVIRGGAVRNDLDVLIEDGRIRLLRAGERQGGPAVDLAGAYLLPGFVEIHTHGAGLFEFTMGQYDPRTGEFDGSEEVYARELPNYATRRARTGVTGLYLGTWASPIERQKFCFGQLRRYMDGGTNGSDGSMIFGGLLEGTFINARMAGAQNPDFVFEPDLALFEGVNETGVVRLANVTPDYGEASCALIESLSRRGISVGAGHTNATYDQFTDAIGAGLKYCIHFLNGPIGSSHKTFNGGGAVEAVLREDIYAELICDGVHVAPAYVRDVLARKGFERVMAVTDAMFSSQAEGVEEFAISGMRGRVDPSGRFVYVVDRDPITLFSSVLTMDQAFSNLLSWLTQPTEGVWYRHEAMALDEAVAAVSRCCSTNIVEMLRRKGGDDLETGEIRDGGWADLVVARIDGGPGEYRLEVRDVYVRGRNVVGS